MDLIYANHSHLLPLPNHRFRPEKPQPQVIINAQKPRSRISNTTDLYDSEGSTDGFVTLSKAKVNGEVTDSATEPVGDMEVDNLVIVNGVHSKQRCKMDGLIIDSLNELACFYDNVSFLDSYMDIPCVEEVEGPCSSAQEFSWSPGYLLPGQSDDVKPTCHSMGNDNVKDLVSCLSVRNLKRSQTRLKCVMDSVQMLDDDLKQKTETLLSIGVDDMTMRLRTYNIEIPSRYVKPNTI